MNTHRMPRATYRLQLHGGFAFADAQAIVPYLADLGISDLYLSPILTAREDSEHGYDVVDPTSIHPALGGEEAFEALAKTAREHGMGMLVDIVPNHMAIGQENHAWMDVLEHGPASKYAPWFDIHWHRDDTDRVSRMLIPVLGRPLDDVLRDRELQLVLGNDGPVLQYFDWTFPLDPGSWSGFLQRAASNVEEDARDALNGLAEQCIRVPSWRTALDDAVKARQEQEQSRSIRNALRSMVAEDDAARAAMERAAREINGGNNTGGGDPLRQLLAQQPYLPCFWHRAMREMPYRRFFDITHLIGIRVEDELVFHATHQCILDQIAQQHITGLRIDHIDGLAQPGKYLARLQQSIATALHVELNEQPFHILVEKILEDAEPLRDDWPICGTTGYEFLNGLNDIFIDPEGLHRLHRHAIDWTGNATPFHEEVIEQKRIMAEFLFTGEIDRLMTLLLPLREYVMPDAAIEEDVLKAALLAVSCALPVYRTYIGPEHLDRDDIDRTDREPIDIAFTHAEMQSELESDALTFLRSVIHLRVPDDAGMEVRESWLEFIIRWQQFTGPLMAKGLEDTALYRDARLLSLNEVGVSPRQFVEPGGIDAFHARNLDTVRHQPHTMTTTSTHDTKRSEDVRARLNVLSELASQWTESTQRWRQLNERFRRDINSTTSPDPALELLIYQSILGIWPLESDNGHTELVTRIEKYAIKAAREATRHTNWVEPNDLFENAVRTFVRGILNPDESKVFLDEMRELLAPIAWFGMLNGLAQTVLKIAAPGSPDFYQGCDLWDFTLVDPDNRRPVDYEHRRALMHEIPPLDHVLNTNDVNELIAEWRHGQIKQFITRNGLHLRRTHDALFRDGEYLPCSAAGASNNHLCAFARRYENTWIIAAAPIRVAGRLSPGALPCGDSFWNNDALPLPADAPHVWRNVLTNRTIEVEPGESGDRLLLPLRRVFARMPVALLIGPATGGASEAEAASR